MIYFKSIREGVRLPVRADPCAVGFDVFYPESVTIPPHATAWIPSGIKIVITDGHLGTLSIRASVAKKMNLMVVGQHIHPNYTEEIQLGLYNNSDKPVEVRRGDRIIQLFVTAAVTQVTTEEPRCLKQATVKSIGLTGLRDPLRDIPDMTEPLKDVLCIASDKVHRTADFFINSLRKGFTQVLPYQHVIIDVPLFSVDRGIAELSTEYLQLLPYVLIKKGDKYLSYRRGKAGTEAKLHDKYSIGIGGHVDIGTDYKLETLNSDLLLPILAANIEREIDEEIGYQVPEDNVPLGCLVSRDHTNPTEVGWFHIGILYVITVPKDFEPKTKDEGMKEFRWLEVNELRKLNLEPWSQAAIDYMH